MTSSTRVASPLVWHATLSSPTGARERALFFRCWHWQQWQTTSHLDTSLWWFFPTQEFLEVGLQWWVTLQIFIFFTMTVPASPLCLDQWASSNGTSSVCYVGRGNGWASSTLASCSGLSSVSEGAPPLAKVTHFCLVWLGDWVCPWMVPLRQEVTWGPSILALGSPWEHLLCHFSCVGEG